VNLKVSNPLLKKYCIQIEDGFIIPNEYIEQINSDLNRVIKNRSYKNLKIRSASKKPKALIQCDLDGNELTKWRSAYQACKLSGWKYKWQTIGKCALGKRLTAYGFIWRYELSECDKIR